MSDNIFTYARGEQCLLVERATDRSGGPVALGFITGDTMVRRGVIVDREKVGELFNALGAWLGEGDGRAYVVMCDDARTKIIGEIHGERARQDAQWGGPAHDDTHTPYEWLEYIERQANGIDVWSSGADSRFRFVNIAALALAAVESIDRTAAAGKAS